jgi:Fe-S-cluster-containing dehydrogenase component
MNLDRRSLLKGFAGTAAAAGTALAAEAPAQAPADAVGLLYDATRCIGCKTCVLACKEANGLPPDPDPYFGALYDEPSVLSGTTKNIIKEYRSGDANSFVKSQCMHCIDPACVNACMIGALKKREFGIVSWDGDRCIGCRYCAVACPFEVPKFEWNKATPKLVKCELCKERLHAGKEPACSSVCPRKAVVFGKREDLLKDAHERLDETPARYNPKIYGETDAGGTQVLYLSKAGITFQDLGLPDLGNESVPKQQRSVQHGIYNAFLAPAGLFVALAAAVWRTSKAEEAEKERKQ